MAEEGLRNIERHAMASRVTVTLRTVGETHLELRIADNGGGFDVGANHSGHFGLVGLRELAQLIGAEHGCDAPRKIVVFDLDDKRRLLLQLSAASQAVIRLTVTRILVE
jgi:glucose-6-phosphate-specific signal transduction histidine kinase